MNRRLQFNLRALLVVTTCVCIWLGWHVREIARQRRAIAAIEAMGGMVRGFYDQEPGVGFRKPVQDDFLYVAFIQLSPREPITITDEGLRQLAGLRNLRILTFFDVPITDAELSSTVRDLAPNVSHTVQVASGEREFPGGLVDGTTF